MDKLDVKRFYKLIKIFVIVSSLILIVFAGNYYMKSLSYWYEYTTCLSNFDKNNEIDYFDRKNTDRPCQSFVNEYLKTEEISFDIMKVGFWLPVIFFGGVILRKIVFKSRNKKNKLK